jgi:hypothetical protein
VQHSQHHYAIALNAIEDGIGECRNNGTAHVRVDVREHLGVAPNGLERRARRGDETFA